jgi:hypothetical protein
MTKKKEEQVGEDLESNMFSKVFRWPVRCIQERIVKAPCHVISEGF